MGGKTSTIAYDHCVLGVLEDVGEHIFGFREARDGEVVDVDANEIVISGEREVVIIELSDQSFREVVLENCVT